MFIFSESNTQSSEDGSSEDICFKPSKKLFQDTSNSFRPSAGIRSDTSSISSITDLQKLTVKVLKSRLSDLGIEESSFRYDKKQTLVEKVHRLQTTNVATTNVATTNVAKPKSSRGQPPKAKPKVISKLIKSASESD